MAALFLAYKLGRILVEGHVGAALTNAQDVWDFERLAAPAERGVAAGSACSATLAGSGPRTASTRTSISRPPPPRLSGCTCAAPSSTSGSAGRSPRSPRSPWWSTSLFPLAPPRMLTAAGMVDTGHAVRPVGLRLAATDTLTNQYAAMPSLHVGWALAVAIALIAATRSRWRWLWLAHPVATLLVVV